MIMKLYKRKKKEYIIGDYKTDDINDWGITSYYYKRCTELEEKNYKQFQEICRLKKELELHSGKIVITELEVKDII